MQGVTLTIAIVGSVLVLSLRPPHALAAYIASVVWYPYYLVLQIGTIDISVGRIVVAVLFLRCLCDDRIRRKFAWSRLDTWVALSMAVYVGMYFITRPLGKSIENRGGFLMDTWLAYLVVRLIITDRTTLVSFIKVTGIVLAALAMLGVVECITGQYFFLALKRFRPWRTGEGGVVHGRWGLTRANGPFGHSIMFGACFVMFLPLIWVLRHQRGYWGQLAYLLSAIAILGALSSMSSGPWVMLMAMIFCLAMEKYKHWVKPLLIAFVLMCILATIEGDKPLYRRLIAKLNPVGGSGVHRSRIVSSGIKNFDEWWLAGYGGKDPGWGEQWGRSYTDVTNQFVRAGVDYGLLGVIALCAVLAGGFRGLVRASKQTTDMELKSLYWSLGSVLFCLIVFWMGVSIHGQAMPLTYAIFGLIGSSFAFVERAEADSGNLLPMSNSNLIQRSMTI